MNDNFFVRLFVISAIVAIGSGVAQEMQTNVSFPKTATFSFQGKPHTLTLTGVATRETWFSKVYDIASYFEEPETLKKGDEINYLIDSSKAKQLTIRWLSDMNEGEVREEIRDALGRVTSNAAQIVAFAYFFGAVKKGDNSTIRWMPKGIITVSNDGRQTGKMKNQEFAKLLWSVWFGKDSVVDREALVSLIRNAAAK